MPTDSTSAARVRTAVTRFVAIGTLVIATACGSSATAPATGTLTVTIAAPANVTPSVKVTGPNGYNMTLAATTTLTGLAVGSYTIAAAPVTIPNPIVATLATATVAGSPANVTATGGPSMATATYTIRPGSGGLWVSSYVTIAPEELLTEYSASQLASGGNPLPVDQISGNVSQFQYEGIAFDGVGNLWASDAGGLGIVQFPANQLTGGGTPGVFITTSVGVTGLAFDGAGDLWATDPVGNSIFMFTPAQLGATGSPVPAVMIGPAGTSLDLPQGLAFDASGNLWVTNFASGTVVAFTPAQLAASGTPTPAITIGPYGPAAGNTLWGPVALAFDVNGNLWVANGNGQGQPLEDPTLVEFSASSLAASGAPAPINTLNLNNARPFGLAFDARGDLWMSNLGGAELLEVLQTNPPTVTVPGIGVTLPFGLAFYPHASSLPIKP